MGHRNGQANKDDKVNLNKTSQVFILAAQAGKKKSLFTACFCLFHLFLLDVHWKKNVLPSPRLFCYAAVYQAQMCKLLKECFLLSAAASEIGYKSLVVTRFLLLLLVKKKKKSFKLEGDLEINRLMLAWANEVATTGVDLPNQSKRKDHLQPAHSLPPH